MQVLVTGLESYLMKTSAVVSESWGFESLKEPVCLLVFPADGDGKCELVVGYTDRVVRAFRWEDLSESSDHVSGQLILLKKWLLEGQVRKPHVQSRTCHTIFKR